MSTCFHAICLMCVLVDEAEAPDKQRLRQPSSQDPPPSRTSRRSTTTEAGCPVVGVVLRSSRWRSSHWWATLVFSVGDGAGVASTSPAYGIKPLVCY